VGTNKICHDIKHVVLSGRVINCQTIKDNKTRQDTRLPGGSVYLVRGPGPLFDLIRTSEVLFIALMKASGAYLGTIKASDAYSCAKTWREEGF
jgi:hypothetical protein